VQKIKTMHKLLLSTFLSFIFSTIIQAQTRYVAVAGNDLANDCSLPGNPCATISNAVLQALEYDTIYVASGTYAFAGTQMIDKSLVVIGQDSLNKPIITAAAPAVIEVTADSVTISNLRIEMGLTMTDGIGGIVASGNYNGLVIDHNEIISTKLYSIGMVFNSYGILASGGAAGQSITISNNIIEPLDSARDAHGRAIGIGQNGVVGPGASIFNNSIKAFYPIQAIENTGNLICNNNWFIGIVLITYPGAGTTNSFTFNTFDAYNDQIADNLLALLELRAFNNNTSALVQGNSFLNYKNIGLFSSASRNITVLDNEFMPSDSASDFISIYANTKLFTSGTQNTNYSNQIEIKGNEFGAGLDSMGAAIVFGDHFGATIPAFEDTLMVGGPNANDKNTFDIHLGQYIVLDTLSGPSNAVSFWSGYSISNMIPFTQSVYALAAYNEYNISDTIALEAKMIDSLDISGLGKVILFDSLVVTSNYNIELLSLNVFPNPSSRFVHISHKNISGNAWVSIINLQGKLIYNFRLNASNGCLTVPIEQLSQGTYLMIVQNNNEAYQCKFIKE
jgi:hypothetical protein